MSGIMDVVVAIIEAIAVFGGALIAAKASGSAKLKNIKTEQEIYAECRRICEQKTSANSVAEGHEQQDEMRDWREQRDKVAYLVGADIEALYRQRLARKHVLPSAVLILECCVIFILIIFFGDLIARWVFGILGLIFFVYGCYSFFKGWKRYDALVEGEHKKKGKRKILRGLDILGDDENDKGYDGGVFLKSLSSVQQNQIQDNSTKPLSASSHNRPQGFDALPLEDAKRTLDD